MRALILIPLLLATGCSGPFGSDPGDLWADFSASVDRHTDTTRPEGDAAACGAQCQLAPRVRQLTATLDEDGLLGVRLEAHDVNADVVSIEVAVYDADGALLQKWDATAHGFTQAARFTVAEFKGLPPSIQADVAQVGVVVTDGLGQGSGEARADVGPVLARTLGESCDSLGVADHCGDGACEAGTCVEAMACPEGAYLQEIALGQRVSGSTRCSGDHAIGSCGATEGADLAFAVNLPDDGEYEVALQFPDFEVPMAIYARTHCGSAQTEIGCAAGENLRFSAEAGTVYIWVDPVEEYSIAYFDLTVTAVE